MQTLAALIAVAIFLLPLANASPLLEREGFIQENFSLGSKDTSLFLKEKGFESSLTAPRSQRDEFSLGDKSTFLSPQIDFPAGKILDLPSANQPVEKGLEEGALTAPRSQAYWGTACLFQPILGVIMSIFGALGMFVSGAFLLLCGVGGGIADFIVTLMNAFIVGISDFPWVWEALLVAAAGSLLVIMAVSLSLFFVSLLNIIIGVIVGAIVGGIIGLPFFIVGAIPGAIIFGIIFGLIFALFSFPSLLIGLCILAISFVLWLFCFVLAIIALLAWYSPATNLFFGFSAFIWVLCGGFIGLITDCFQTLIPICHIAYGVPLLVLSMLFLLSSACFAYGFLFILGPLNLVIAVVSSCLGFIPSVIGGILAVVCFIILGVITLFTQIITWLWNSVGAAIADFGAGLGGLFALEAPASISKGLIGLLISVLGGLLFLTGFGLPLGIPMIIFGIIMMLTGLIPGILTSIYNTCFAQCFVIQNCLAIYVFIFVWILTYLAAVSEAIVYLGDILVGGSNYLAWLLWTLCTSSFCVCALAPWGIALPSWCASLVSLFSLLATLLGCGMDLASWCMLALQSLLIYLWETLSQFMMD